MLRPLRVTTARDHEHEHDDHVDVLAYFIWVAVLFSLLRLV